MANAKHDQNRVPTLIAVSSVDGTTPVTIYGDPTTHRLLVDLTGVGSGDVVGPASATDNAIVRFDSTTGKLIQNSGITVSDTSGGTNLITIQATGELNIAAGGTENIDFTVNGVQYGFIQGSDGSFQWGSSVGLGLIIDQNGNLTQINQLNYNWPNVDDYGVIHRDSLGAISFSPGGATVDNTIARFDGIEGKLQASPLVVTDAGALTGISSFNLPVGSAPTAPVDGDVWREDNTNTGLKIRINGVTKTITVS